VSRRKTSCIWEGKLRCLGGKNAVSKRENCCVCRRVRELHFVDIVDVEQLLDVMGQDVPQVAERVQRLLLPSYFPGACHCRAVCAALTQRVTEGMKHQTQPMCCVWETFCPLRVLSGSVHSQCWVYVWPYKGCAGFKWAVKVAIIPAAHACDLIADQTMCVKGVLRACIVLVSS